MPVKYTTTAKATEEFFGKFCVYGPSGGGKTILNATLPVPFIIAPEKGNASLSRKNIERIYGVNTPGICYDIPVAEVSTLSDMRDVQRFVMESNHARHFQSISLDSVSDIAEVVLSNAKKKYKDPRQAYGELIEVMSQILRDFRDIPNRHVYFSAKQDREQDQASGMMLYSPMMPGKELSKQLPYFFDEVFNMGVTLPDANGIKKRFLRTNTDAQFIAKDRSGALLELEEPNLGKIIAKIKQQ